MINRKKYILGLGLLFAILIALNSCNKTISSDSPLAKVVAPQVLVPTNNGTLYALDAKTGIKNWEYKLINASAKVNTTPLVAFDSVAFFTDDEGTGNYYAVNIKTGKELFRKIFKSNSAIKNNLAFYSNRVYVTTSDGSNADSILQLDDKGVVIWRNYCHASANRHFSAAPSFGNNKMYIPNENGTLECYDLSLPNFSAPIWTYNATTTIPTNPVVTDSFTYLTNASKEVHKINNFSHNMVWKYTTGNNIVSSPVLYGDMVVVGSEDFKVYCIDNISGKTTSRWIYATLDRVKSSACFNKESENLIIGSNDFNLYAINHVNGQLRWKFPTSSIINTSPVDYNGNVVFSCMDKYCYCVNASTGKLVWKYNINSIADASPMVCTIAGTNYYPAECFNSIY